MIVRALAFSAALSAMGVAPTGAAVPTEARSASASSRHADPKLYHATGVIKAFGPKRAYVNITHDDIPGYMSAMTMSFWPLRPEQLDGLKEGDCVAFDFSESEDARRILASIRKQG